MSQQLQTYSSIINYKITSINVLIFTDHIHGIYACTCCGVRDTTLSKSEISNMWSGKAITGLHHKIVEVNHSKKGTGVVVQCIIGNKSRDTDEHHKNNEISKSNSTQIIVHKHRPYAYTCCGVRSSIITAYDKECIIQQQKYRLKHQMITRIDPVHGKPNPHCVTIASMNNECDSDEGFASNQNSNGSNEDCDDDCNSNTSDNKTDSPSNNDIITTTTNQTRLHGGRPQGTTNESKRKYEMAKFAARFKICCQMKLILDNYHPSMGYKYVIFKDICNTEIQNFQLHPSFTFNYNTTMTCISRSKLEGCNKESPLIFIEDKIVQLVVCMNNIKRSLSVSEGLTLVNEIIIDTDMQQ